MKRVLKPINGVLVALAILAVVGCKRNEEVDQPGDGVLRIAVGVRSSNPAGVATMAQTATAAKSLFVDGDRIGLYVTRAEDTLKLASNVMREFEYSNLLYTRAGGVFGTAVGSPAGTVYYPYKSVNVDLWGIYPYDADAITKNSSAYPWSVKVEQNSEAAIMESDFLAARVKGVAPSVNTPVPVEFEHKTSRLYMRVQIPTEIDGKPLKMDDPIAEVYFEGMTNVGRYNFNANVFGPDPQGAIVTMPPLARGRDTVDTNDLTQGIYLYYELLGIPQTVKAGNLFVRMIVNYQSGVQGLFLLEAQENIVLQQGKQHVFEVGFDNNQRLRLDGTKILDWDEVSHTNADLDENETIRVGSVEWSMGNLVANGQSGCRIGEPTDGGLYFHFGSLIGWSGGASGDGTGAAGNPALEVKVKPSAYTGSTTWPAGYTTDGNVSLTANSAAGTGDPCRYYLGSPWRLPINTEISALYSNVANGTAWAACATGAWQATPAGSWAGPGAKLANGSTAIFFPASGFISASTGVLSLVGTQGYGWSSVQPSSNLGYFMVFSYSLIWPQDNGSGSSGFPVRCVKDVEVVDQPEYVTVDGLKWKTSNEGDITDWYIAMTRCTAPWRLPSLAEVESLIASGRAVEILGDDLYWSSTERNSNDAYFFNYKNTNYFHKANARDVRCVSGGAVTFAPSGSWVGVSLSGASREVTVTVSGGGDWTAAAAGSDGLTVTPASGKSGDKTTVTWSANTSGKARSGAVAFSATSSGESITMKTEQSYVPDYVTVDGLKWATGNLVADGANGARIGAPTDGGLYFQFGSLIGWKGGTSGDGTGRPAKANGTFYSGGSFNAKDEVQVVPTPFTTIADIGTTWPDQAGTNLYYFGYSTAPYATAGTNIHDFAGFTAGTLASAGVGDPCRQYLGGTWRMPTYLETKAMTDLATKTWTGSWTNGTSTDSYFVCTFAGGAELKFPAVGYRHYSYNGAIYNVGEFGYYWSSSVYYSGNGYNLDFNNGNVNPQSNSSRRYGFPVRCVQ